MKLSNGTHPHRPRVLGARRAALALAGLAGLWMLSGLAPAQEQEKESEGPPPLPQIFPESNDVQSEIVRLFGEIERNLQRIDTMLNDAGAGEIALAEVESAGIDKLLRETTSKSQSVVRDIDKILEIAKSQSQGGSLCCRPKPDGQGKSPLDEQKQRGPLDREGAPEKPQPEKEGQPQGAEQPKSPGKSDDPGATRPGRPFDPESGDPARVDPDSDPWGMLPERAREIFRNQGSDEMPVQYRDWIDAYYRRLSRDGRP